jgi:hypothetical protein
MPAEPILPLFISFHLNSPTFQKSGELSSSDIKYLKKHSPIGCRDYHTLDALKKHDIPSYFSGCLTLTLANYKTKSPSRRYSYIFDPLFNFPDYSDLLKSPVGIWKALTRGKALRAYKKKMLIKKIFDEEFYKTALTKKHVMPTKGITDSDPFKMAECYLKDYADAKLVVTSRIHCALPCLAMGVPVIFINAFDTYGDACRFGGLLELFNRIDIAPDGTMVNNFGLKGKIDGSFVPQNPNLHEPIAAKLKDACEKFIRS